MRGALVVERARADLRCEIVDVGPGRVATLLQLVLLDGVAHLGALNCGGGQEGQAGPPRRRLG